MLLGGGKPMVTRLRMNARTKPWVDLRELKKGVVHVQVGVRMI